MDLIFNDYDTAVVRRMDNQMIRGLQTDDADVALERMHQSSSPPNDARPAKIVEHLVDSIAGNDVKEVLAIDKVPQRPSNQVEVRISALVCGIFPTRHSRFSCASIK